MTKKTGTMLTEQVVETYVAETDGVANTGPLKHHTLDQLKQTLNGEYGSNVLGRLAYNLNFIAQRQLRTVLKYEVQNDELDMDELMAKFSEDEVAQVFGFDNLPEYTLSQTVNWVMITYVLGMDVAKITEANDRGEKSHPYAWMKDLLRTPVGMITHDAAYALKQSIIKQRANMALLGLTDSATIQTALDKFEKVQSAELMKKVEMKVDMVRGYIDTHYYKNLSTETLHESIEEMCADLGLNIPKLLMEIADKARDSAREKALAGSYIAEPDSDLLSLASKDKEVINAAAEASYKPKQSTSTGRDEKLENPDTGKRMRRVTKEQAAQQAVH